MQSYYSMWLGGHYSAAKLLSVNGVTQTQDPFIAPNGKYLVYVSGNDLFATFLTPTGWSPAQKFGPPVNTGDDVGSPYVSHDGKTLYITSDRLTGFYKRDPLHHALNFDELEKENDILYNGSGNIYYIPVNLPDGN
jgi:Tol biopolymer transport system component